MQIFLIIDWNVIHPFWNKALVKSCICQTWRNYVILYYKSAHFDQSKKLNQIIFDVIENGQIYHVYFSLFVINYSVDQVNDVGKKNKNWWIVKETKVSCSFKSNHEQKKKNRKLMNKKIWKNVRRHMNLVDFEKHDKKTKSC